MSKPKAAARTESPTPRRLQEARKEGQVALSKDLVAYAGLFVFFAAFAAISSSWLGRLVLYLRKGIEYAPTGIIGWKIAASTLKEIVMTSAFPIGALFVTVLLMGLMQTKGLIAVRVVKFEVSRVLPKRERIFALRTLREVAKGIVKVTLLAVIAYAFLAPLLDELARLPTGSGYDVVAVLGGVGKTLLLRVAGALAVLGVADYLLERHLHWKSLKMTREEVKRETKETEGDPYHKAERLRLHREIIQTRMIEEVKDANFVVVHSDPYAVAIRYHQDTDDAPAVLAKGEALLAEKIKQIARENGIPILHDVVLAQSLRSLEAGEEIPEALYEKVAQILAALSATTQVRAAQKPQEDKPKLPPSSTWVRG